MNEPDRVPSDCLKKLRGLLTAARYTHTAGFPGRRQLVFEGRLRQWVMHAFLTPEWFHVYTVVCALPTEPGLRAELLQHVLRANAKVALLKYSVTQNDQVVLEFEVRAERLDVQAVRNLIGFLHGEAEVGYLAIVRLASGEARLETLSGAFKLPSSREGAVLE